MGSSKGMRRFASLAVIGLIAAGTAACGGNDDNAGDNNGGDKAAGKVGVILPDSKSSVRWETQDRPNLEAAFKAAGLESIIQNAEG